MDIVFRGAPDPCAELNQCVRLIEAAGGGKLTIEGEHIVNGTIQGAATDLEIDFGETGKLIAAEGQSVPLLLLYPIVKYIGCLVLRSPRIDCSRAVNVPATLSASGVCVLYYARVEVYGGLLDGGNRAGDSGFTPQNIISARIEETTISGWGDLGVYVTGENGYVPLDGRVTLKGVKFKNCRNGVDSKRGFPLVTVKDCTFTDCGTACLLSWVGTDADEVPLPPGQRMDVTGGCIDGAQVAFHVEGGARMQAYTKVKNARDLLAKNKGGTLDGQVNVGRGSTEVAETKFRVGDQTYRPKTTLKVVT